MERAVGAMIRRETALAKMPKALTRRELAWRASGWARSVILARMVTRLDPAGGYIRVVSQ
jgi:hypothetical protein